MFIYEFRYSFGPFDGDYAFYVKGVSPLIDVTRRESINYCRRLITTEINEHIALSNKFKELYPDELDDSFKFTLDDLHSKLDDLNKHADNFVFTGQANIDQFRAIRMTQIEILTL